MVINEKHAADHEAAHTKAAGVTLGSAAGAALAGMLSAWEVYVLVSMKYGMLNREDAIAAKLSEHGLSMQDAERIHRQVADQLVDETSQLRTVKRLAGVTSADDRSLTFDGVLWPGFAFVATSDVSGALASAQYIRANGQPEAAASPLDQPPWSMDSSEFSEYFGPATVTYRSALFDGVLPAHEMHEFEWAGVKYGAGFSWGLFLFASKLWT